MITKSAENPAQCAAPLVFTRNARTAWGHIIANAPAPAVLLPAYIGYTEREGSGVLDPVEAHAAPFGFYRVDNDLRVDLDDFARQLASGGFTIALVIHYFGICRNDMARIKALCSEHGVLLVEDCAHAFQLDAPGQRLGNYGDFSFYSLHKYLASSAGGALKVNSTALALGPLAPGQEIALDDLAQYARTNFGEVATIRRANYLAYEQHLPALADCRPMYRLADDEIAQSFAVRIGQGLREQLYFHLIERNIPVTALYYRLIDQLKAEQYPVSFAISGEILNLPVHQDIDPADVVTICAEIAAFFRSRA